jgi:hypothetical protein
VHRLEVGVRAVEAVLRAVLVDQLALAVLAGRRLVLADARAVRLLHVVAEADDDVAVLLGQAAVRRVVAQREESWQEKKPIFSGSIESAGRAVRKRPTGLEVSLEAKR